MSQLPPGVDPSKIPLLPPPEGQESNFINPTSLAPVAEGVGGLLIAIETTLLILRTYSNVKTFGRVRFEDYWVIFAATLTYGYFALIMCFRPIARHEWNIPLTASTETLYKLVFAQEMMLGSVVFFSKTSLLLLYYRVFSPDRVFRYKLYGAVAFIAATTLSSIPMYLAVCLPDSDGSWERAQVKCGKTVVYSYVQGPTSVAFDLFLLYLPASAILHLHLPLRRKLGILAIFMTGTLAVVASVVGLVYRIRLVHELDSTWGSYIVELCLLIEACVSIICSCMPTLPAISKLIMTNSYVTTLRSLLRSHSASSNKSKSSKTLSRQKGYPGNKNSHEFEPYIELLDNGADLTGTYSGIKTRIQHIGQPNPPENSGINMAVELEISSTQNTPRESKNRKQGMIQRVEHSRE